MYWDNHAVPRQGHCPSLVSHKPVFLLYTPCKTESVSSLALSCPALPCPPACPPACLLGEWAPKARSQLNLDSLFRSSSSSSGEAPRSLGPQRRNRGPRRARGVLDQGAGRLLGHLERAVAVDVEPGAADEEHDVMGQVEDGGDGGEREEEEDDGPCWRGEKKRQTA